MSNLHVVQEKWSEIISFLQKEYDISKVSFESWIKPLVLHEVIDDTIFIMIPDVQFLDYIKKKYEFYLKVSVHEILNYKFDLQFITQDDLDKDTLGQTPPPATSGGINSEMYNLNSRYTFDTFVVGDNNMLAHRASVAVAESPGELYNPLFIYGGVGLGKTHLMHSIAHYILEQNKNANVLYVTSEMFTNELIESLNHKKTEAFREKYRALDVLLIDDIQFISGKESTQREFFHTFNDLREKKKHIIISSDRPPKEVEILEERLSSRFLSGLTVDIQSPDYETRMAILNKKCELDNLKIDTDILEYIAANVTSNIRELEGSLTKIVALSTLTPRKKIDMQIAEAALKDIINPEANRVITPDYIIGIVADYYRITIDDIKSSKKPKEIAFPRQVAMYLCRQLTDKPLQTIGMALGKKDHTTVKHGADKISKEIQNDTSLKSTVDILIKKITTD